MCHPTKLLGLEVRQQSAMSNDTALRQRFCCAIICAYGDGVEKVDSCFHVGAETLASLAPVNSIRLMSGRRNHELQFAL